MSIELIKQENEQYEAEVIPTGLRCLVMVARSLGIDVDDQKVCQMMGVEETGWDARLIVLAAKKQYLKAKTQRIKLEDFSDLPVPSIALLKDGNFVVTGQKNEEKIVIFDPYQKAAEAVTIEEFVEMWAGEVIAIKQPFSFKKISGHFNLQWFLPVMYQYKKFFGEVLATAFFLQLFGLITPLFTQVIIDKVIVNNGTSTLDVLAVALLVAAFFQSGMGILRTYLSTHTTNKVDAILGTKLFRHIAALPLRYFETRRVGDTLMRIGAMNSIREFFTGSALTVAMDTFFSVVFIVVMLYYSTSLTLVALAALPIYLVQNLIATPIFRQRLEAVWATGAENNAFLVEAITGIMTVKALAIEPQFIQRWEKLTGKSVKVAFENASFNIILGNIGNLIQRLSSFAILWYGGHMVMSGQFTIGQLIAFQMLSGQANAPLMRLVNMWQTFQQAGLSIERLGDILNTGVEPQQIANKSQITKGEIVFENVSFRYVPQGALVLKNVTLTVKAGTRVGIVGRSGSGKSTLAKLAQRLYLLEGGRVLVDGVDLNEMSPAMIRRQIGVVLQENYLFNGSVRDNIALARPGIGMDEVVKAAQTAGAHEFILELPEGYDTKVGERGASLSGGQRQRIAIARLLITNPRIIIFDEATSALDYHSEKIIMDNLDEITAGRTMLMIAHRLSTIRKCDSILVIEQGELVEQGNHEELMSKKGLYYHLYMQQQGV